MDQIKTVENILSELDTANIPVIKIYNKIDLLTNKTGLLKKNLSSDNKTVYISAKTSDGIQPLKEKLRLVLFKEKQIFFIKIPKSHKKTIHSFPKWLIVLKRRESNEYYELKVMAEPKSMIKYMAYIQRGESNW